MKMGNEQIGEYRVKQIDDALETLVAKGLIERVGGSDDDPLYGLTDLARKLESGERES